MADSASQELVRCRVVYSGRVQGVFFRATAQELSRDRAVVGYVRNLPAGTVELEAEGRPEEVGAFLSAVARHFAGQVTHTEQTDVSVRGDETAFEIRY